MEVYLNISTGSTDKRMEQVAVNSLQENSIVNKQVFLDEKYILLTPDIPITRELINRLFEWDIRSILTDGVQSDSSEAFTSAEASDNAAILEQNIREKEHIKEANLFYKASVEFLTTIFEQLKIKDELRIEPITQKVKEIINELKNNSRYLLSLPDTDATESNYLITHSVKTTFIAIVIANFLKLPNHRQIDIGIASLLHEIGMLRLPSSIYMSDRKLTIEERKAISTHPIIAFKTLKQSNFPMPVNLAVLEHHECVNGSGYPRGITEEKISLYGKLLAIACSYDAATSIRPYREGRDGHSGIMELLKDSKKKYDERLLRALVYALSIYPIGTFVLCSNNSQGIVAKTNPENPKYPIVKLLLNENGEPYIEMPILQTGDSENDKILRPLSKEEIKSLKEKTPILA